MSRIPQGLFGSALLELQPPRTSPRFYHSTFKQNNMSLPPSILNVHTPSSSFAIVHSLTQESMQNLYDKLSRKAYSDYHGQRVSPGWLKYHWNQTMWNLDDESDYTIFVWRQNSSQDNQQQNGPTLHLHNPQLPLPTPPAYLNPAYYLFQPTTAVPAQPRSASPRSARTNKTHKSKVKPSEDVPKYKKEFDKFHSENGVRTVMGSIGPVENVRMLLKNGYRHVYISRKFAMKHAFIPADAAPGHYGYGGLVNIGTWPITLTPSSSFVSSHLDGGNKKTYKPKATPISVYLSEEPHFDVVLGRSFFERRQIKVSPIDPTDVVCQDTGEKVECELVILKDGRGEIVTVT